MKRTLNIISDRARIQIPNTDSVDISKIINLINCSTDTIFCYIFEYIQNTSWIEIFHNILNKLRPEGNLILRFTNFKKVCGLYQSGELSDKEFLDLINNKTNILSIDQIISLLDNKFSIIKIDYINNDIVIVIQRVGV